MHRHYESLGERTEAVRKRLKKVLPKPDAMQAELLNRLAHQLALAEQAEIETETHGIVIEGLHRSLPNPAINVGYNANQVALRIINQLDLTTKKEEIFGELDLT